MSILVAMQGDHPRVINPKPPPEPVGKMLLIVHMYNRYHMCMREHEHLSQRAAECAQLKLEVERLRTDNAILRAELMAIEDAELKEFLDSPHTDVNESTPLKHGAKSRCCVIL
jgi:hypothetical protein